MSQEAEELVRSAGAPAEARAGEARVLRFGVFELDAESGALRKSGALVKLRQQPFRVLALLATRPGRVVTRDELRDFLWGADTFVDFDQGLNYCIKEIRAALGDSAETPLYVETLPRRGYRFIAPVEGLTQALDLPTPLAPAPIPIAPRTSAGRVWARRIRLGHLFVTLSALGVLGWLVTRRVPEPADWRRVTFRRGTLTGARFGPGGEIAYSAAWDGQPGALFAASPGVPDARDLGFSTPDIGVRLVGVAHGEIAYIEDRVSRLPLLARAPLAGGPAKPILEGVLQADVTADGARFAVAHFVPGHGIQIEYPIGRVLAGANAPSHLRISPDRRYLAFIEHPTPDDDRGQVSVLDESGRRITGTTPFSSIEGLAWSPASDEVYFTAAAEGGSCALRGLDLGGRQRRILPASGRLVIRDVDASGRALVERKAVRGEISLLGSDGSQRDLSWFDASRVAALSADGKSLLFDESGDAGGPDYVVYLRPTDGGPPVRLGAGVATALAPDGRTALAIPIRNPNHIEMLPIGTGVPRALRHPGIVQYQWASYSPDGSDLIFVGGEQDRNLRVWAGGLTAKPRPITPEGLIVTRDTISPDGRLLAAPCAPATFCLYPLDGRAPRPIPGIEAALPVAWDASGRTLYVRPRRWPSGARLERLDIATGVRTPWLELQLRDPVGVTQIGKIEISRDGHSVAFGYARALSELYLVDRID